MSMLSRKATIFITVLLCTVNTASAVSMFSSKDKHKAVTAPFYFYTGSLTSAAQVLHSKSPWELNPRVLSNANNKAVFFGYRVKSNWEIEGGYAPKFISQLNAFPSSEQTAINSKIKPTTNNDSRLDELLSGIADYELLSVGMAYHFD